MTALVVCTHRFLVETPAGPTVAAVCTRCGAKRTYVTAGPTDEEAKKRRQRNYDGAREAAELGVFMTFAPQRNRKEVRR